MWCALGETVKSIFWVSKVNAAELWICQSRCHWHRLGMVRLGLLGKLQNMAIYFFRIFRESRDFDISWFGHWCSLQILNWASLGQCQGNCLVAGLLPDYLKDKTELISKARVPGSSCEAEFLNSIFISFFFRQKGTLWRPPFLHVLKRSTKEHLWFHYLFLRGELHPIPVHFFSTFRVACVPWYSTFEAGGVEVLSGRWTIVVF